jgi:hypothetical protein
VQPIEKMRKESGMVHVDEYRAVVAQMEEVLAELDRLQLGTVAVHVDLALRTLEDVITYGVWRSENSNNS